MGDPVKIVVLAETDQAVVAMRDFLNGTNAGLKQVSIGAKAAGESVAGMSYYFRSGIDSIRYALAGGGPRAGFYALDEAVRGLIASGTKLSTIAPAIGIVAAAASAGLSVWREWTSATREAEQAQKDLETQMKGVAKIFDQYHALQKAGLLSPEASQKYLDLATGKTPLYKRTDGTFTTDAEPRTVPVPQPDFTFGAPSTSGQRIPKPGGEMETLQNAEASAEEVRQYIKDQLDVPGKITQSMIEADAKNKDVLEKLHTEALSDAEQEKAKIHEKYQAERDEIDKTASDMGTLHTAQRKADDDAAKALSLKLEASEQSDVDRKVELKNQQAAQEQFKKQQEEIAKSIAGINTDLAHQLSTYKEETAEAKRLNDEKQRLLELQSEEKIRDVLSNPYTSSASKAAGLTPYLQGIQSQAQQAASGYSAAASDQERLDILRQTLEWTAKYNALLQQQKQLIAQSSFKEQFAGAVQHLKEMNNLAKETAQTFQQVFNTAINSISENFTKLIEGTESWGQAIRNIGSSILNEVISAIVGMAVRWIATSIMMAVFGEGLVDATAALYSAAWAGPAILATIASYGSAAAAAPPEVMGALAFAPAISALSVAAREMGGPVRAGMPYIVGEKRPELFVPSVDGHIEPSIPRAYAKSGAGSSSGPPVNVMVHFQDDPRRTERDVRSNPNIHHIIVDVARRNHQYIQARP